MAVLTLGLSKSALLRAFSLHFRLQETGKLYRRKIKHTVLLLPTHRALMSDDTRVDCQDNVFRPLFCHAGN